MKNQLLKTMLLLFALIAGGSSAWADDTWVKTAPTDLTSGDVVVLVDLTSGKAMSNNNGASSAPSATAVTLNDGKTEITSAVADNLQWTVTATGTGDSRTYQLATGTDFLYVTKTNNGVRVGSGERNTFTIKTGGDNSGYYLYNQVTGEGADERYVGCYNNADWRCYTSINNNIKGNNNAFFKKVSGSTPTCATPTFSPAAGAYISAQNVTITCATEGATLYYTTNGDAPTTSSNTITSGSSISVSSTCTVKVLAKKDGYNDATANAEYTFPTTTYNTIAELIAAAPTSPVILNLTDAQVLGVGNNDMYVKDASDALDLYKLGLSYTAGQILNGKVVVTGYTVYNGMSEITGINENQIVASAGTLPTPTVLANASDATLENYKWKFVTVTGTATAGKKIDDLTLYTTLLSFNNFIANVDNVTATGLIIPYKSGENPVIPELLPTSIIYNITLSKDMVTYCSTNKLNYSGTGLKVYKAKVDNGAAVLTEIENAIVTNNKGIILSGTANQTYNIPIATETATTINENELYGVTAETAVAYSADSKYNYILQNGVFKKATGAKLKAGKAYLKTTYDVTAAGAPELKIVIDGETTGIADVRSKMEDVRGDFFDLQGRKVAQPTKGLYIVNGKKVVIK